MSDALKALKKAAGVSVHVAENTFQRCKLVAADRVGLVVEEDDARIFIPWAAVTRVDLLDTLEASAVEITGLDFSAEASR